MKIVFTCICTRNNATKVKQRWKTMLNRTIESWILTIYRVQELQLFHKVYFRLLLHLYISVRLSPLIKYFGTVSFPNYPLWCPETQFFSFFFLPTCLFMVFCYQLCVEIHFRISSSTRAGRSPCSDYLRNQSVFLAVD